MVKDHMRIPAFSSVYKLPRPPDWKSFPLHLKPVNGKFSWERATEVVLRAAVYPIDEWEYFLSEIMFPNVELAPVGGGPIC